MTDEDDAQTAALQEYFEDNTPAGYGAAFRAGWEASRAFESSQRATAATELIFTNAEFCRFVQEAYDQRQRADRAEAEGARLRAALNLRTDALSRQDASGAEAMPDDH